MQRRKKAIIWWVVSVLWLALTIFLSSQVGSDSASLSTRIAKVVWSPLNKIFPGLSFKDFHYLVRKLAHFGVHAVLAFNVFRASWHSFRKRGAALATTIILAGTIAVINELIQLNAPGRTWAVSDVGLNLLGISIGTCFSAILP